MTLSLNGAEEPSATVPPVTTWDRYELLELLGKGGLALAHYPVETGGDPTEALASARRYLDRSENGQPESLTIWFDRLVAAGAEAKFRWSKGADPMSSIATGRAALQEARLGANHARRALAAACAAV